MFFCAEKEFTVSTDPVAAEPATVPPAEAPVAVTAIVAAKPAPTWLMEFARCAAASGFFSDAREMAQAVVQIQAAREIGFGPVAGLTGIRIIKGKVSHSATIMAAAVKKSVDHQGRRRYDYRVLEMSDESVTVEFTEYGKVIGTSPFTMVDAKRAGLAEFKDDGKHRKEDRTTYEKFPRNMLFARAMSNGVKWFCPDVFNGNPVYTPDELDQTLDVEGVALPVIDAQGTAPDAPDPANAQF